MKTKRLILTLFVMCIGSRLPAQTESAFKAPEDINFRTANIISEGTRMAADVFSPKDAAGKLPTIVMSHGWGGTAEHLRPDVVALSSNSGTNVLSIRIHGCSGGWKLCC